MDIIWVGFLFESEEQRKPVLKGLVMTTTEFDAVGFARFDLAEGRIVAGKEKAMTLIPVDVVAQLAPTPGLRKASADWGHEHGSILSNKGGDLSMDELAQHLQTTLALMGLGRISIEIYGDALVFGISLKNFSITGSIRVVIEAFLKGYLKALKDDSDFSIVKIIEENGKLLLFAGNPQATEKVQLWIEEGVEPLAAVQRLNQEGGVS